MTLDEKVIGYEPQKAEIKRYVDILSNPVKYKSIGAKIPRGLLLNGVPGVGKTLIAECIIEDIKEKSKENGTHFYSKIVRKIEDNGSIKDAFDSAKKALGDFKERYKDNDAAAVIVFDDVDKWSNDDSKHRNNEHFIAIQSLIDECKNFNISIIMTANTLSCMPYSLLRKGRMDINISIPYPTPNVLTDIAKHYLSKKTNVESDIAIDDIVSMFGRASIASVETAINEAAILAIYEGRDIITESDVVRSALRVLYETPEKVPTPEYGYTENARYKQHGTNGYESNNDYEVAVHEAGHVLLHRILKGEKSVACVSIRKHIGNIAGTTFFRYKEDANDSERDKIRIASAYAGTLSVESVFNKFDFGGISDNDEISSIINSDIKIGFYGDRLGEVVCCTGVSNEDSRVNGEIVATIRDMYRRIVKRIIDENHDFISALAYELVDKTYLLSDSIEKIFNETVKKDYSGLILP